MLVRELMSTPVVTVTADATLDLAVERMLEHGVGSVVAVTDSGGGVAPAGIVTETDVLETILEREETLANCTVRDAASSPLETIQPDRTVGDAVDRMVDAGVTHLPVVDGLDVRGMITMTDVALCYEDVRDEAMALARPRDDWTTSDDQ